MVLKVKTLIGGILIIGLLAFSYDYYKLRQEHAQVYGYLAGVVAVQKNNPISRAAVIESVLITPTVQRLKEQNDETRNQKSDQ